MKLFGIRQRLRENFSLKIYVSFLTANVLICGLLNLAFFQWQKENLKQQIIQNGKVLARVLAHNVKLGVFSEDKAQLQAPMEAILRQQDVDWVAVYNLKGKLLALKRRHGTSPTGIENPARLSTSRLAVPERVPDQKRDQELLFREVVRVSSYSSEEALYFPDSSAVKQQEIGFVQVAMSRRQLRQGIRDLLVKNLAIGIFILLIGALVTYLVVLEVTKPLNRLINEVRSQGVDVDSGDQLSILSGTYNKLVAQLGKAFDTINTMKETLEDTVDQRTGELAHAYEELSQRQVYLEEMNRKLEETLRQLKETQAQMVHSEKMVALGHLVAGVAHEINNTTNFITGALSPLGRNIQDFKELLASYEKIDKRTTKKAIVDKLLEAEDLKDEIEYDQLLQNLDVLFANIKEGARRTSQIVNDLKNFARPGTAEWKPIDIHESIDSTLALLYSEYKQQIELVKEYEPDLPPVPCSPSHLNQVFMNILLNAVQAIEGSGRIMIRTWKENENLHISIKDTGPGIPEEIRNHIFEPFFTTKTVGRGTGLGLSISYGIIRKHRGRIKVDSEPGQGTEFEIILPLAGTGEAYIKS